MPRRNGISFAYFDADSDSDDRCKHGRRGGRGGRGNTANNGGKKGGGRSSRVDVDDEDDGRRDVPSAPPLPLPPPPQRPRPQPPPASRAPRQPAARRPVAIVNIVPPDDAGDYDDNQEGAGNNGRAAGGVGALECICMHLDQRLREVELSLAAIVRCMKQCHEDMDRRLSQLESADASIPTAVYAEGR